MDTLEGQMQLAIMLIQLLLAIAAFWYTFETRQLRIQSQRQLALLEAGSRMSVAPYLVPGIVDIGLEVAKKQIAESSELSEGKKVVVLKQLSASTIKYVVQVLNPTTKIPNLVNVFLYDVRTKSFMASLVSKEIIEEKGSALFPLAPDCLSLEEVMKGIDDLYGTASKFIGSHIGIEDMSYIITTYRDLEGRVYLIKRSFDIAHSNILHKAGALYYQG